MIELEQHGNDLNPEKQAAKEEVKKQSVAFVCHLSDSSFPIFDSGMVSY